MIVAVVVPSPTRSPVRSAASRINCAPRFSSGSLSSTSFAIVTPSLQTRGRPHFLPISTHFDFGPRVMRTASANAVAPLRTFSLASDSNNRFFAVIWILSSLEGGENETEKQHAMDKPAKHAYCECSASGCVVESLPDSDHIGEQHPYGRGQEEDPSNTRHNAEHSENSGRCREPRRTEQLAKVCTSLGAGQQLGSNEQGQDDPNNPGRNSNEQQRRDAAQTCIAYANGCSKTGKDDDCHGLPGGTSITFDFLVARNLKTGAP